MINLIPGLSNEGLYFYQQSHCCLVPYLFAYEEVQMFICICKAVTDDEIKCCIDKLHILLDELNQFAAATEED